MTRMTGGQALARSLLREGVRTVFGIPGAGQYEAVDALWETPEIRYVSVRHEQAATYMADGYARAGGGVAAAIVVPGPGAFNALAGMATADDLSSPMLVVTGDGNFRDEATDEHLWFGPLARWTARVERPAEVPEAVQESMRRIATGRPGPVLLQVPWATLKAEEDVELSEPEVYAPPPPDPAQLRRAARLLQEATRIAGGLGRRRRARLRRLGGARRGRGAPPGARVTSSNGKGAVSDRHPLSLGFAELRFGPLREWVARRDVVLAVGTRTAFDDEPTDRRVVRIDIDPARTSSDGDRDVGITGDATTTLEALLRELRRSPRRPDPHGAEASALAVLREARFAPDNQLEPQRSLMAAVRRALPDDGIVVQGMNQMGYYSRNFLPVYASRAYLTASHHGTLGHAFPVGVGAKIARPDRAVVVLSGDGGFLYNSQELATAVQHGVNVVVIVFNDNAYGNVLRAQMEEFDGHVLGTRLRNPDFVALARSYGARGVRADGRPRARSRPGRRARRRRAHADRGAAGPAGARLLTSARPSRPVSRARDNCRPERREGPGAGSPPPGP